jgi:hypothetical protein
LPTCGEPTDSLLSGKKGKREKEKGKRRGDGGPFLAASTAVECWIGVAQEGDRRVVRLAGRFGEAQVPELMQVCAATGAVSLDLTELVSTDATGLEALSRVRDQGATITGAPTYIQLRLDSIARKSRSSQA